MKYGNQAAIRKLIKLRNEKVRPGRIFTQVSAEVYEELDMVIERWVDAQLMCAPSVGKTFRSQTLGE